METIAEKTESELKSLRIYFLDDEEKFIQNLKKTNSHLRGQMVLSATVFEYFTEYEELLENVKKNIGPIDMVVSDYDIKSDKDGIKVLEEVRNIDPRIKLALLTGQPDPKIKKLASEKGIHFIEKSILTNNSELLFWKRLNDVLQESYDKYIVERDKKNLFQYANDGINKIKEAVADYFHPSLIKKIEEKIPPIETHTYPCKILKVQGEKVYCEVLVDRDSLTFEVREFDKMLFQNILSDDPPEYVTLIVQQAPGEIKATVKAAPKGVYDSYFEPELEGDIWEEDPQPL